MPRIPTFTSLRKRLFDGRLSDAGFQRGDKCWYREVGCQIHAASIQFSRGEFTFNLMFHYDFLPSLWTFSAFDSYLANQLDFMLDTRVGEFMPDPGDSVVQQGPFAVTYDHWWPKDDAPEVVESNLIRCAEMCLSVFDYFGGEWQSPDWFLQRITPSFLLSTYPVQLEHGRFELPLTRQLLHPWSDDRLKLSYSLSIIAKRHGQLSLAREYAEIAKSCEHCVYSEPAVDQLLAELS